MVKTKTLSITNHINTNYRDFALYTLEHRGIPNFYDALTSVQRLIIMNTPLKKVKALTVVGSLYQCGYHHGNCLDYDTLINLADGSKISIGDWANNYPELKLLVNCIDEKGNQKISIGHSPRIGQDTNEIFEIELENGEIFKCTPNHPFLVNGEWIEAKDLTEDMELTQIS